MSSRAKALALALAGLVGIAAVAAAEEAVALKPLKSTELIRRGAGLAMLRSYLALGRFYLKHNRPDRARQILTYGLLHDPSNPELLSEAARACVRLGQLDEALAYAAEAQRLEPLPERVWAATEIERLLAAKAAAATPATTATTAPPPMPAAPAPAPVRPEGELAAKVRALHVAAALEGAIKGYNSGKPKKARMSKLDVDKLKAEHFLPDEFDLKSLKVSVVTSEGKVTVEGQGTVADISASTGPFEKDTADVSKRLAAGDLAEAAYLLREMRQKFPKEPEVKDRLLYSLRLLQQWDEALKLVEADLKASPEDPRLLYEQALLMLQAGKVDDAKARAARLGEKTGAGIYAILGRELAQLATHGVPRELEQDLQAAASGTVPSTSPAAVTTPSGAAK
ncbi:MAG: tetratricopeptide repeat protein [Candidatus Wallbacteria bacterium]|nr:tetratricopeptide repeat protein [Candidatus Wallbacteria bacterium]